MDAIEQWLLTTVLVYKYAAIFLITFLNGVLVIIPGGAVLIASGYIIGQGYLSLPYVIISGTLGSVAGDVMLYWITRRFGETFLTRIGLGRFIRSTGFRSIEKRFAAYPKTTIFTTRFSATLSTIANILAGFARISLWKFLIADAAGQAGDTLFLCACGFLFGSNWQYLEDVFGRVAILVGVVAILIFLIVWRRLSRRHSSKISAS